MRGMAGTLAHAGVLAALVRYVIHVDRIVTAATGQVESVGRVLNALYLLCALELREYDLSFDEIIDDPFGFGESNSSQLVIRMYVHTVGFFFQLHRPYVLMTQRIPVGQILVIATCNKVALVAVC